MSSYSKLISIILLSGLLSALTGCQFNAKPHSIAAASAINPQEMQQQQQTARTLFAQYNLWTLDSSPMQQAYRGLKSHYGEWDDLSEKHQLKQFKKRQGFLKQAQDINPNALNKQLSLSLNVLKHQLQLDIDSYPYRHHSFPVNQLTGLHSEIPNLLINIHKIETIKDARNFINRVKNTKYLMKELVLQLKMRTQKDLPAAKLVYASAIKTSQQLLKGYPVDRSKNVKGSQHILWTAFEAKIETLTLYESSKKVLRKGLRRALQRKFKPAYRSLIAQLKQGQKMASKNTGLHQHKNGNLAYDVLLQSHTNTGLTPQTIHQLGLNEITRIKQEITALLPALGERTLAALFTRTRHDKNLYFQNTQEALTQTKNNIRAINLQLNKAFHNIPNIPMRVEEITDKYHPNTAVSFYKKPSRDGKKTGLFIINSHKLNHVPAFQFETLTYNQSIPGQHLQTIYTLENKQLPEFRRHLNFAAYTQGWGLYAELLVKELGTYTDPWQEYGRLLMELKHANSLVIDTGLHTLGWDIEKAINFRLDNTPFSKEDSLHAIENYLAMPGQACADKIGQLMFIELRELAQTSLAGKFKLGLFHEFILQLGPLPLSILKQEVKGWIAHQKA